MSDKIITPRKQQKYCVLDFDEFWEACTHEEETIPQPWDEIHTIRRIYNETFPTKRIDSGMQKMFLDEVKLRVKKGLQWIRSGDNSLVPILFVFGTISETQPIPSAIRKTVDKKMVTPNSIIKGYYQLNDVGLDNNGIYISADGLPNKSFDIYYFESERELLSEVNRITKLKHFTMQNWVNVMISRGKRGFNNSLRYQFFYQLYNPTPGTPSLFGNTSVPEFFAALSGTTTSPIEFINSEYYYATVKFNLPPLIGDIQLTGLERYFTLIMMVNKDFVSKTRAGNDITKTYFDIVSTIGTDTRGTNATGARIIVCLGLIIHAVPELLSLTACFPESLNVQYHKACFDMWENRHKAIWIASGKGSGKSKIIDLIKDKHFICIDSDTYGRVLYQMAINVTNPTLGCPFTEKSDPIEFATWIYNFMSSSNFNLAPSFHELQATEFCIKRNITIANLLTDSVKWSEYRNFSNNLTSVCSKLIKVQNFCNLIGYIPSIVAGFGSENVPTMIIFGHNTLELFPSMTNAMWKMESSFDTTASVISRKRASDAVSQLFLCAYYDKMEPLITNALPTYIIVRALATLPAFVRE